MQLSDEIIDAFVKTLPNGEKDNSNGYELYYGTVKVSDGKTSVILDGSPVETPLNYLTMGAENGDRVTCIIKDHSLIVTGNLTHPSEGMTTKYIETMTVLAQEAAIGKLIATEGDFTELTADSAFVKRLMSDQVGASILTADEAFVGSLQSQIVTADKIKAMQAEIGYIDAETLEADYIDADTIKANYVDTKTLQANYIDAETIRANYIDAETIKANYVDTETLEANYIDAETLKTIYLQADMANLKIVEATKASIANLLADMAFVKNATISQGHITGALDSVTLNANYITAGSLSVDRLYINGDDGKPRLVEFNEDGEPVATTIDASILTDRTITADKLVANSITANEISTDFITAFKANIMQTVTEDLHAVTAEIEKLISGDTELDTLKLKEPLAEQYGGTGVNDFNDLFKTFRDRDYRLNYTRTNLLNPTAQTQTINGVTFTNNGDGTYIVNGTASPGDAQLMFASINSGFTALENTKLVGCPVRGASTPYRMHVTCYNGSTWLEEYVDYGNGVIISDIPSEATSIEFSIFIKHGVICNNLLYKPMLTTDKNATYDDFVRYSGDGELNENVANIYHSLLDKIYPIGSVYTSYKDISPETFLGGRWNRLADGLVLRTTSDHSKVSQIHGADEVRLNPNHIPRMPSTSTSLYHEHSHQSPAYTTNGTTLTAEQSGLRSHAHRQGLSTCGPRWFSGMEATTNDSDFAIHFNFNPSNWYCCPDANSITAGNASASTSHSHSIPRGEDGLTSGPLTANGNESTNPLNRVSPSTLEHSHFVGVEDNDSISIVNRGIYVHMWVRVS